MFNYQAKITEKEIQKRREREEFFMEGIRLSHERKEKLKKIDQIKQRKLNVRQLAHYKMYQSLNLFILNVKNTQDLKNVGVPEKYCKEIERKCSAVDVKFSH